MSFPCGKHHGLPWRKESYSEQNSPSRLSVEDVFRFRLRNRRCSADEEKLRETHRVSYSRPSPRGLKKDTRTLSAGLGDSAVAPQICTLPKAEITTQKILYRLAASRRRDIWDVFRFRIAKSSVFSRRRKTPGEPRVREHNSKSACGKKKARRSLSVLFGLCKRFKL